MKPLKPGSRLCLTEDSINQERSDAFDKAIRGLEAHRLLNTCTCAYAYWGGGGGPSADVTVQAEIAGVAKPPPHPPSSATGGNASYPWYSYHAIEHRNSKGINHS